MAGAMLTPVAHAGGPLNCPITYHMGHHQSTSTMVSEMGRTSPETCWPSRRQKATPEMRDMSMPCLRWLGACTGHALARNWPWMLNSRPCC